MYSLNLPFSIDFKNDKEHISFFVTSRSQKNKLKEAVPKLHSSDEMHDDLIDIREEIFEICTQLNKFIAFANKRKKRFETIADFKPYPIGYSHKELQYFHMVNLIEYLTDHKEYCTHGGYEAACRVLFSDEFMNIGRSDALDRGFYIDGLNYSPISNHELDIAFSAYIQGRQKPIIYDCAHIIDVPLATLDNIFRSGNIIKKCQHCGKIFVPQRVSEQYCNGQSPEYNDKTCKEAMKYKKQLERESQNPMYQEYKRTYNALYRRTLTRDSKKQERAQRRLEYFMIESEKFKTKMNKEEYINWLVEQKNSK